jgi:hypothetical protein
MIISSYDLEEPETNVWFVRVVAINAYPINLQTGGENADNFLLAISGNWLSPSEFDARQRPNLQDAVIDGLREDWTIPNWPNSESTGKGFTASVNLNHDANLPGLPYRWPNNGEPSERRAGADTSGHAGQFRALLPRPGFYGMVSVGLMGLVLLAQKSPAGQKKARI